MKAATLLFAAVGSVTFGLALLSACADSISAGTDVSQPPPASFTDPDSEPPTADFDAGMCISYECPEPYITCSHLRGLCNVNPKTDFNNCGGCENACPPSSGDWRVFCSEGECRLECMHMFGDCNGQPEDGCEVFLENDPLNCGACGKACKQGEICWRAACGCPPGHAQCGDQCVRLERDVLNCGACGNACELPDVDAGPGSWPCGPGVVPPQWGPACASSSCTVGCKAGAADCNGDLCGDGCETDLRNDPKNCGACGQTCDEEQRCIDGKCQCQGGLTFCGECVSLLSDPKNCGVCGNVCPGYSNPYQDPLAGNPICDLGRCSYYCPPGRANCDQRTDNGCEVDIMVDPKNCGGCGVQCDADGGQPCAAGQCLTKPCAPPDGGGVF